MDWTERLGSLLGVSGETASRGLATLGILLGWFLVLRLLRRVLSRSVEQTSSRFQVVRLTSYAVGFVSTLLIVRLWAQGLAGIATYFGLVSAGLAIAFQDPLTNFAGWLFIILRRPFTVGDRIQIGTHIGDVVDIRPLRLVMLEVGHWVKADQSTGRVLHVPNGWVFKHSVANYDEVFPFIWNEIEVVVTFESDWRATKRMLTDIVNQSADKLEPAVRRHIAKNADTMLIQYTNLSPVVWTEVVDSGVKLTMRYLCRSRERRSSASAIWEKVLDAFSATPTIECAYPTIRRYDNRLEGPEPGAGAIEGPPEKPSGADDGPKQVVVDVAAGPEDY